MIDANDFDGQIERELNRVLGSVDGASIPAWRTPGRVGLMKRIAGGAWAAISLKVLTGVAVIAFAAAGTEAAVTGSLDPSVWGQRVKAQVTTCKDALGQGEHGIGQCVSAFAKQHGQQNSDQHQNPNASQNQGKGKGQGQGQGQGGGNSNNPNKNQHSRPSPTPHKP